MSDLFVNDRKAVLVDSCNRFIYEVLVYVNYDNFTTVANHKYFSSDKEIKNIVECYQYSKHIEIFCELYSAPKRWLIDNDFTLYVKPEKNKRNGRQKIKTS